MGSNLDSIAQHSQIALIVYTLVNYIFCVCWICALRVLGCQLFFHLASGMRHFSLPLYQHSKLSNICLLHHKNSLRCGGGEEMCSKMWQAGIVHNIEISKALGCSMANIALHMFLNKLHQRWSNQYVIRSFEINYNSLSCANVI